MLNAEMLSIVQNSVVRRAMELGPAELRVEQVNTRQQVICSDKSSVKWLELIERWFSCGKQAFWL